MRTSLDASSKVRTTRVLLVEDEPGDRELLEIALKRNHSNCELECVEDGVEAMKYLRRQGPYLQALFPDLLILDLNLPKKDGREVLREIKEDENLRGLPVIILSTSRDDGDVSSAYKLGASSYIVKPGNFHEFNVVVSHLQEYWFNTVTFPRRH